ncbi:hypothetical protein BESB_009550 [Besnoitia besnoiti]|uniref:Uncharacterized protein n=1 Tax=Besnoitia besnoiti TaxID=94643 RepID=A0A2A9MQM5_BESBE|nr:hypothetical protein BESB_009550 [Besnoitia besnoiti]PFH38613.1 hypothetical protein BESB_009550 [Besnoitia besnoiti]
MRASTAHAAASFAAVWLQPHTELPFGNQFKDRSTARGVVGFLWISLARSQFMQQVAASAATPPTSEQQHPHVPTAGEASQHDSVTVQSSVLYRGSPSGAETAPRAKKRAAQMADEGGITSLQGTEKFLPGTHTPERRRDHAPDQVGNPHSLKKSGRDSQEHPCVPNVSEGDLPALMDNSSILHISGRERPPALLDHDTEMTHPAVASPSSTRGPSERHTWKKTPSPLYTIASRLPRWSTDPLFGRSLAARERYSSPVALRGHPSELVGIVDNISVPTARCSTPSVVTLTTATAGAARTHQESAAVLSHAEPTDSYAEQSRPRVHQTSPIVEPNLSTFQGGFHGNDDVRGGPPLSEESIRSAKATEHEARDSRAMSVKCFPEPHRTPETLGDGVKAGGSLAAAGASTLPFLLETATNKRYSTERASSLAMPSGVPPPLPMIDPQSPLLRTQLQSAGEAQKPTGSAEPWMPIGETSPVGRQPFHINAVNSEQSLQASSEPLLKSPLLTTGPGTSHPCQAGAACPSAPDLSRTVAPTTGFGNTRLAPSFSGEMNEAASPVSAFPFVPSPNKGTGDLSDTGGVSPARRERRTRASPYRDKRPAEAPAGPVSSRMKVSEGTGDSSVSHADNQRVPAPPSSGIATITPLHVLVPGGAGSETSLSSAGKQGVNLEKSRPSSAHSIKRTSLVEGVTADTPSSAQPSRQSGTPARASDLPSVVDPEITQPLDLSVRRPPERTDSSIRARQQNDHSEGWWDTLDELEVSRMVTAALAVEAQGTSEVNSIASRGATGAGDYSREPPVRAPASPEEPLSFLIEQAFRDAGWDDDMRPEDALAFVHRSAQALGSGMERSRPSSAAESTLPGGAILSANRTDNSGDQVKRIASHIAAGVGSCGGRIPSAHPFGTSGTSSQSRVLTEGLPATPGAATLVSSSSNCYIAQGAHSISPSMVTSSVERCARDGGVAVRRDAAVRCTTGSPSRVERTHPAGRVGESEVFTTKEGRPVSSRTNYGAAVMPSEGCQVVRRLKYHGSRSAQDETSDVFCRQPVDGCTQPAADSNARPLAVPQSATGIGGHTGSEGEESSASSRIRQSEAKLDVSRPASHGTPVLHRLASLPTHTTGAQDVAGDHITDRAALPRLSCSSPHGTEGARSSPAEGTTTTTLRRSARLARRLLLSPTPENFSRALRTNPSSSSRRKDRAIPLVPSSRVSPAGLPDAAPAASSNSPFRTLASPLSPHASPPSPKALRTAPSGRISQADLTTSSQHRISPAPVYGSTNTLPSPSRSTVRSSVLQDAANLQRTSREPFVFAAQSPPEGQRNTNPSSSSQDNVG